MTEPTEPKPEQSLTETAPLTATWLDQHAPTRIHDVGRPIQWRFYRFHSSEVLTITLFRRGEFWLELGKGKIRLPEPKSIADLMDLLKNLNCPVWQPEHTG